jgi:membrane protein required for colicin V production
MDFHIVDMVIIGLVLFLAIKGLVNGFSKELFNFLGLIGGIAVAARTHEMVGKLIAKQNILPQIAVDYQKVIGFIVVFLAIWILFNILASIISNFSSNETGVISRIIGYLIGIARYGFIFALIVFGLNNTDFLKEKLSKYYEGSKLFNPMVMVGEKLLNRESNQTIIETNATIESNATIEINSTISDINTSNVTTQENNSSD